MASPPLSARQDTHRDRSEWVLPARRPSSEAFLRTSGRNTTAAHFLRLPRIQIPRTSPDPEFSLQTSGYLLAGSTEHLESDCVVNVHLLDAGYLTVKPRDALMARARGTDIEVGLTNGDRP